MGRILLSAVLLAAGWRLLAQPAQRPSFEVASIKPSPANCSPGRSSGATPGRIEMSCVTVRNLIRGAYGGLAGDQLAARMMDVAGGPAWLDTDHFDISAKADGPARAAEMIGPMLQALLEERFQLKMHLEPRETSVYALTVAKGGPKLTPAKEGSCVPLDLNNPELWRTARVTPCGLPRMASKSGMTTLDAPGTTMEELAGRVLPSTTNRPVVDKTGLTGRYDVHLEFSREMPPGRVTLDGVPQPAQPTGEAAGPSIFTALQDQLGLKLSSDKAPINVIVVDSVQKPAAN
jgi:uncharacterized protein (TIGR03435 family)